MTNVEKQGFHFIGIPLRTSNENGQAAQDIPAIWHKFISENLQSKIPNKINENEITAIYTNYEDDFMKPYTMLLGCLVSDLTHIPEGMIGQSFENETYCTFNPTGKLQDGIVIEQWKEIWSSGLQRKYTQDLEIYQTNPNDPEDVKVEILIAI
ncbi:MAG: GyrI-like domain-containing protein [Flavobacteriales bacterium]